MSLSSPSSLLAGQVRRLDRDRFVTALFAPAERRWGLFGLYAFNLEVAQIRDLVSEPVLGQIRLQWWRDAVDSLFTERSVAHPVAEVLKRAINAYQLSRHWFDSLLDARGADLDDGPPATLDRLQAYANGTAGSLNGLVLEVLGVRDDQAQQAARHLGIAWALTGLLRAVPYHASRGRLYLPADLLAEQNVPASEILAGRSSPGLARAAEALAERARHHLALARRLRPAIPPAALRALLTAPLAERYLQALARADYDLFDSGWSRTVPRPILLAWNVLRRRY